MCRAVTCWHLIWFGAVKDCLGLREKRWQCAAPVPGTLPPCAPKYLKVLQWPGRGPCCKEGKCAPRNPAWRRLKVGGWLWGASGTGAGLWTGSRPEQSKAMHSGCSLPGMRGFDSHSGAASFSCPLPNTGGVRSGQAFPPVRAPLSAQLSGFHTLGVPLPGVGAHLRKCPHAFDSL